VTDAQGNTSNTITITTFRIDTAAPTLSQVLAIPGLSNDSTPSYTFNSNEAGTINYTGSCSSSFANAFAGDNLIAFNVLSSGTYTDCDITVTDTAGNTSGVLQVNDFTLDLDAPVIAQSVAVPTPTTDSTPPYTFTSDQVGDINYIGTCRSNTSAAVNGSNAITFNSLPNGTYNACSISVTDSAGNVSNVLPVSSFTIDSTDPILSVTNAIARNGSDSSPNFTFFSIESGTITYGGSCASGTTSAVAGNNTITLNALGDGTYSNCTVTVTDALLNASDALQIPVFTIDTVDPVVTQVTAVAALGSDATPRYVFNSTEFGSITYGGACSSTYSAAVNGNNNIDFNPLANGTYNDCTVSVTDAAGNTSTALNVPAFKLFGFLSVNGYVCG
jgi:uncharacterized protein YuzB (UPF0349 family)